MTINGETYNFGDALPAAQCSPDFFGVFQFVLGMVDEGGNEIPQGGTFTAAFLSEGTDSEVVGILTTASVSISTLEQDWYADEEQIEEFELEP